MFDEQLGERLGRRFYRGGNVVWATIFGGLRDSVWAMTW